MPPEAFASSRRAPPPHIWVVFCPVWSDVHLSYDSARAKQLADDKTCGHVHYIQEYYWAGLGVGWAEAKGKPNGHDRS